MKKSFLLAAALGAAVVTSCSKDETTGVNTGKGITFNAFTNNMTRVAGVTEKTMGSFKVHALTQADGYSFTDVVSSSDEGVTWKPAYTHYWPSEETAEMHFYGYSPADLASAFKSAPTVEIDVNNIETGNSVKGIVPKTHADEQADFVISYAKGTRQANEASGVTMNFKHALSQIVVQAKCSNENMKVEVVGVKIAGANGSGDLALPTDTQKETTLADNIWTTKTPASYMAGGKTTEGLVTLTSENQDIMFSEGGFMLLPQQLTAWNETAEKSGAYISVLCRISQNDGSGTFNQLFPSKEDAFGFAAVPVSTKWEAGKKYTYNLEFFGENGGGGVTDPDPTDPTDPSEPDPDKPVIDPEEPGGEPVVGGPIRFDVTVDEWNPVTQDTPMGPSGD